jgi:ABC-type polysaccharide/polyol phosphate export permease
VILGFIIGSVGIHLLISCAILAVAAIAFSASIKIFLISVFLLFLIALLGFGLGIVGTAFSLVWEGKSFLFDYSIQALIFLSCFYYPLETLPKMIHGVVRWLPTYQAAQMIQQLFLFGSHPHFFALLSYIVLSSVLILCAPALFLDYSVKKYGIVGY